MVDMVFEIVNERLPRKNLIEPGSLSRNLPRGPSSLPYQFSITKNVLQQKLDAPDCPADGLWKKMDEVDCAPDQQQIYILRCLEEFLGWDMAIYEYPSYDDEHQYHISHHKVGVDFLKYDHYQAWRNRKVPSPGLLCVTGSGMLF